jgi:hypothetical protein
VFSPLRPSASLPSSRAAITLAICSAAARLCWMPLPRGSRSPGTTGPPRQRPFRWEAFAWAPQPRGPATRCVPASPPSRCAERWGRFRMRPSPRRTKPPRSGFSRQSPSGCGITSSICTANKQPHQEETAMHMQFPKEFLLFIHVKFSFIFYFHCLLYYVVCIVAFSKKKKKLL